MEQTIDERIIEPPRRVSRDIWPVLLFAGLWQNGPLIWTLTLREVTSRYRGSFLGLLWPFLQPLLLLAVYTFVFSFVFGARWPGVFESDLVGYAVVVFCGLVTFNIFAESVRTCPQVILAHRTFVQRVVFPLEVLPVAQVGAAIVHAMAGLAIVFVFLLLSDAKLHAAALWLPVVWLCFAFFSLGVCYLVASISVYVRDFEPLVAIGITGLFFGSGIFYPLERLPDAIEPWVRMLPPAGAVDWSRRLLLLGEAPGAIDLLSLAGVSFVVFAVGYAWFMMSKGGFADAL